MFYWKPGYWVIHIAKIYNSYSLAVLAVVALCNIRLASDMLPVGFVGDGWQKLFNSSFQFGNRASSQCSFKAAKISGDILANIVHMLRCVIAVSLTWDIPAAPGCCVVTEGERWEANKARGKAKDLLVGGTHISWRIAGLKRIKVKGQLFWRKDFVTCSISKYVCLNGAGALVCTSLFIKNNILSLKTFQETYADFRSSAHVLSGSLSFVVIWCCLHVLSPL